MIKGCDLLLVNLFLCTGVLVMTECISRYGSPLGNIILEADEIGLFGLWFEGQKYFTRPLCTIGRERENSAIVQAEEWLDIYFSGKVPSFKPPLHLIGTSFQLDTWEMLSKIPYGETVTYGEIARQVAAKRGIARMSAQAVGGAIGRNKISIILPCHRVVGADGTLVGYAGGIEKKIKLLELENSKYRRIK